jgi:hypothetical protein
MHFHIFDGKSHFLLHPQNEQKSCCNCNQTPLEESMIVFFLWWEGKNGAGGNMFLLSSFSSQQWQPDSIHYIGTNQRPEDLISFLGYGSQKSLFWFSAVGFGFLAVKKPY